MSRRFCQCGCKKLAKEGNRFLNFHYAKTDLKPKWHHTEEWKRQNSLRHKGKVTSEETKRKMSLAAKGRDTSEASKVSADLRRGTKHNKETKRKMSVAQKRLWGDPIWHKKQQTRMARGNRLARPNKVEIKLFDLLDSIQPGDWKYVGDGSLILAGKNPDFVNVNGKKLLIELFGDHWHRHDSPKKRAAIFKPFGFRTLVIWERELENRPVLIRKINRFTQQEVKSVNSDI